MKRNVPGKDFRGLHVDGINCTSWLGRLAVEGPLIEVRVLVNVGESS